MTTHPGFEVSWQQARELAHNAATISEVIQVQLPQAGGMVLAQDIHALGDMPPFAASRIDGWAVSGPGPWQRVGDALAGHEFVTKLNSGECVHTATGAVMPEGATAALKDEESRLEDAYVYAIEGAAGLLDQDGALPYFHDVRPSGYEAKLGELLIPSGTKLTPAIIGVAAGAPLVGVRFPAKQSCGRNFELIVAPLLFGKIKVVTFSRRNPPGERRIEDSQSMKEETKRQRNNKWQ
jgi:molybdopterin molybdotransferase